MKINTVITPIADGFNFAHQQLPSPRLVPHQRPDPLAALQQGLDLREHAPSTYRRSTSLSTAATGLPGLSCAHTVGAAILFRGNGVARITRRPPSIPCPIPRKDSCKTDSVERLAPQICAPHACRRRRWPRPPSRPAAGAPRRRPWRCCRCWSPAPRTSSAPRPSSPVSVIRCVAMTSVSTCMTSGAKARALTSTIA